MGNRKSRKIWDLEDTTMKQKIATYVLVVWLIPFYFHIIQVTDARDGSSRTVRQFQFIDWPEQGVPKSGEGFIDFIGQVHKTKEQFGQDGPITVHCSAGVGRTGVFITLSIVLERMQYEGILDVFQTVRILRAQRPAMVQTEVNQTKNWRFFPLLHPFTSLSFFYSDILSPSFDKNSWFLEKPHCNQILLL